MVTIDQAYPEMLGLCKLHIHFGILDQRLVFTLVHDISSRIMPQLVSYHKKQKNEDDVSAKISDLG